MPLFLLLLRKLRLPTRGEAEIIGLVAFAMLFMSWQRRGEAIKTRDAIIAAKPLIEEHVREVRVEGPVRIVEKIVKQADGACTIERVTERAEVTTSREAERKETPICLPPAVAKTWAIGGGVNLRHRDRGSVGVSKSLGDLSIGLSHALGSGARPGDVSSSISLKLF